MPQYTPYLIADFKTAKYLNKETWLAPQDAFPTLVNAHINKGVLEKRLGMSTFATMKHGSTAQTTTAIMGIKTYLKRGMPQLLIMDTKRVNRYNPVDATMTDIAGSDIFTGSNKDFFWFVNWQSIGYMVNNVDQIYKYTGSGNVSAYNIKISTTDTKTNHLDTCRMMFVKDDRLMLFDTVEFGDWHPQRCRYSPALNTDFSASGGGYVDADTDERMVTGGYIGKDIAIWFQNSLWRLRSTGDTAKPYKWEKFTDTEGSLAPYSGVGFLDGVGAIGLNNLLFFDGFKVNDIGTDRIRDILSDFETSKIRFCYGYNQREKRHILFTYVNDGSTVPDRVLDFNVTEGNFTIHKSAQTFFPHCFGGFDSQKVPIWTETDDVHTGADGAIMSAMTLDSRTILGDPYPYTLVGCRNSQVYKWNDGNYDCTDDTSGKIEVDIQSGEWNPYREQGKKTYLGKICFLVDTDSTASYTLSFYKDLSSTAWKTATLDCTGLGSGFDKSWITIPTDGEVANFHKIKLSHTEKANRPRIHAIEPYFAPAGALEL